MYKEVYMFSVSLYICVIDQACSVKIKLVRSRERGKNPIKNRMYKEVYMFSVSLYICAIDQACSVKMAGYWSSSFFLRFYGPRLRLGP